MSLGRKLPGASKLEFKSSSSRWPPSLACSASFKRTDDFYSSRRIVLTRWLFIAILIIVTDWIYSIIISDGIAVPPAKKEDAWKHQPGQNQHLLC
jgi:hypothetical protein